MQDAASVGAGAVRGAIVDAGQAPGHSRARQAGASGTAKIPAKWEASECKAGNECEADQRGDGGVEVMEGNERRASLFIVSAAAHAPQCKIFLSKRIGGQVGCAGGGEDKVSCK